MYEASVFLETDSAVLRAYVEAHPFAVLAVGTAAGPSVDHLPMLLEGDPSAHGRLIGHVARGNPLWERFEAGPALAVFSGHQAYVSPDWYPTKAKDPRVVPTWNYVAVHVEGELRFFHDEERILDVVSRLTERFESDRPSPWKVDDAPADFVRGLARGVVGLELRIERMVGKYKLSQNRPAEDRAGVVAGLRREADPVGLGLAELMARREGAAEPVSARGTE
jgi:transcriptional regulator